MSLDTIANQSSWSLTLRIPQVIFSDTLDIISMVYTSLTPLQGYHVLVEWPIITPNICCDQK
jgi:hypothetical protein